MIGVGVDMVHVSQFKDQLQDVASVFVQETFTAKERQYSLHNPSRKPERHLAARFAAKEALIKAWASLSIGKPLAYKNPPLQEIEVCNDPNGRPYLVLHGVFQQQLQHYSHSLSLSHDGDYAIAFVVLQERI